MTLSLSTNHSLTSVHSIKKLTCDYLPCSPVGDVLTSFDVLLLLLLLKLCQSAVTHS